MDVDEFVGDIDADGEEGRCERDPALRPVENRVVGSSRDQDNTAALGVLSGQNGDIGFAVQTDDGEEIDGRARDRVGEVANCIVDVRDAIVGLARLDLLQVLVGGGVVEAGDGGEIAWLGVVVGEKVGAAAAVIEAFVDEAGGEPTP